MMAAAKKEYFYGETRAAQDARGQATKKVKDLLASGDLRFQPTGLWYKSHGKWAPTPSDQLYGRQFYKVFSPQGEDITHAVGVAYPATLQGIRRRGFCPLHVWFEDFHPFVEGKGTTDLPRDVALSNHLRKVFGWLDGGMKFYRKHSY